MKVSCIITDDEPLARKGLQGYIEKIPFLDLVATCESALELNLELKQKKPDLLFLDIEMPYLTGIEFLRTQAQPPKVIFTTAYEQYALQGFELDVLDYLLKPISFERFLKAANKAADYFSEREQKGPAYLFIKVEGKLEKVVFDDILFIEALENYLAIYTKVRKYITHATLKSMQENLPAGFVQPHKSYVVNVAHITAVQGNMLQVEQYQVPISKYQKEEVLEKIVNRHLLKK
ncbi:MAG TPA: response regulator transcription factor [Flavisolibacter sp.]|jgi:DNA-binding LytR/AlgR family response regulator|nr:response regulator transcription factor [Flavisolibacter sp.]